MQVDVHLWILKGKLKPFSLLIRPYFMYLITLVKESGISAFSAIKNLSEDLKLLMNAIMAQAEEKISFLMPS